MTWARRHGPKVLILIIFFCAGGLLFWKDMAAGESPSLLTLAITLSLDCVAFVFLLKLADWVRNKVYRRVYAKEAERRKSMAFVISGEQIQMTCPDSDSTLKWSTFTDWAEGPNLFVLFQYRLMYLFPKRRLSEAQQKAFRELISAKLAE